MKRRPARRLLLALPLVLCLVLAACYQRRDLGGGDNAYNYDNVAKDRGSRADWPVNLIFYGPGAEVDNVKSYLSEIGLPSSSGGDMHLLMQDYGNGQAWDTDRGRKVRGYTICAFPGPLTGRHVRVYADSDDKMYNTRFTNYVLPTSHWDFNEGCDDRDSYGDSEEVEQWVATRLASQAYRNEGLRVYRDYTFMANEGNYSAGQRIMRSNGWATVIYIPA